MTDNPFIGTSVKAEKSTVRRQGRNRIWWETKPMTYADWNADDRMPETAEDFDAIAAYVLRTGPWLRSWFEKLEIQRLRCLDLGSGSGIFSAFLSRCGGDVTSMDLTEAGISLTRETTRHFNTEVKVVRGDAEQTPFQSETFDFVFSWGVLHHTSQMDQAVGEVGRILKSGGRGLMMVYHKRSIVYYVHGFYWLALKGKIFSGHGFRSVQRFYTDGYYHRYLTKDELRKVLSAAGLHVTAFHIVQYEKKILPFIPAWLDEALKARFGMCLVAEFQKP